MAANDPTTVLFSSALHPGIFPCVGRIQIDSQGAIMNILDMVQRWRDQRDAIPTEKIKVLRLVSDLSLVRREPTPAENLPDLGPIERLFVERTERRIDMPGIAMLIGTHGKLGVEQAAMQNVSVRGVRVISTSHWYADDTILVSLPVGHFTSAARVAYCDAVTQGRFAVGLEFVGNEPLNLSVLVLD
jgi:hypothetical protein